MDFLLKVDSPGLTSLAHPLFAYGGKRVGKIGYPPLCACAERGDERSAVGVSNSPH
jgi:hypothetical protein